MAKSKKKANKAGRKTRVTAGAESATVVDVSKRRPPSAPTSAPEASATEGNDKATINEQIRRLTETARATIGPLLIGLAGKTYEPDEAEAARNAVSLVNHLAAILKTPLLYEGREVSLKLTLQQSNGRPMFHLRKLGGSDQETVYAKKVFPAVSLKEDSQ